MSIDMSKFTTEQVAKATLSLLKVVPFEYLDKSQSGPLANLKDMLRRHFVVVTTDNKLVLQLSRSAFNMIESEYGYISEDFNRALHKSYQNVANMSDIEFYTQQIMHYFSVYAAEWVGIKPNAYIPAEQLDIPTEEGKHRITVIYALNNIECMAAITKMFKTVQRPNASFYNDYATLLPLMGSAKDIVSFELRAQWYLMKKIAPTDPQELLRVMMYAITRSPLIIKNKQTIETIKWNIQSEETGNKVYELLKAADLPVLSSIFLRNKPLFLALKANSKLAPTVNKLRRLAALHHAPLSEVNIRNLTNLMNQGRTEDVNKVLSRASVRDLIKVGNFALLRTFTDKGDSEVYNIRNGKVFINQYAAKEGQFNNLGSLVFVALGQKLRGKLAHTACIVPSFLKYAAPYSEKQMVNTIPAGSVIPLEQDCGYSLGIHWVNPLDPTGNHWRTDLDLHLSGNKGTNLGWNAQRRASENNIIYSGDIVDAPEPHGATESFYINTAMGDESYRVSVMLFSGNTSASEFKFFFAPHQLERNWVFDPNKIMFAPIKLSFQNNRSAELGVLTQNGFYFATGGIERINARIPNRDLNTEYVDARLRSLKYRLSMLDILRLAGATIITEQNTIDDIPDTCTEAINLMPEYLTTTTFFDIIDRLEDK